MRADEIRKMVAAINQKSAKEPGEPGVGFTGFGGGRSGEFRLSGFAPGRPDVGTATQGLAALGEAIRLLTTKVEQLRARLGDVMSPSTPEGAQSAGGGAGGASPLAVLVTEYKRVVLQAIGMLEDIQSRLEL